MSIKTTHYISRDLAIKCIKSKMNVIESMSDENLEYILEALDESIFRNFCISDEPYCY